MLMYLPAATHSAPNENTSGYDLTATHEYIVAVLSQCRPRSRAPPWPIDSRASTASANSLAGDLNARAHEIARARGKAGAPSPSRSDPRRFSSSSSSSSSSSRSRFLRPLGFPRGGGGGGVRKRSIKALAWRTKRKATRKRSDEGGEALRRGGKEGI